MISKPTTEQILRDCCRTLLEDIIPGVEPGATQIQLFMLEGVLRNAAVRVAHEIAWMEDERRAATAYAASVAAATGDPDLGAALGAAGEPDSLHLDEVVDAYNRAGEALSCAVEAALRSGDTDLADEGAALVVARLSTELEILAGWGDVAGR